MRNKNLFVFCLLLFFSLLAVSCAGGGSNKTETQPATPKGGATKVMALKSSGFKDGETLPLRYADKGVQGGENLSPPLEWSDPPADVKSFALIVVDKNPAANEWVHWAVINIPAKTDALEEGASGTAKMPDGVFELNNTFGSKGYEGPTPPPGTGSHDYDFILYALNTDSIGMTENMTFVDFVNGLQSYAISSAKITGKFER